MPDRAKKAAGRVKRPAAQVPPKFRPDVETPESKRARRETR